jgi:hypothetical protein
MKFEWRKINGIELFTKEWYVILISVSIVMEILFLLIYEGIL